MLAIGVVLLAGGCGDGGAAGKQSRRVLHAESVSALADGHILIGGVSERRRGGEDSSGCDGELAVVRLDARGKLDTGFGDGGTARVRPDGKECVRSVNQLFQSPDGRTLVGATTFHPSDSVLEDDSSQSGGLTRLTSTGRVDTGFNDKFSGFRAAVSPDGSIFDESGKRYLPDGDRDPRDEQASVPVAVDLAVDVAAQPDGKKLLLGLQDRTNNRRLAAQRFDADWQPDKTFGKNGVTTADVAPGKRLEPTQPELERVLAAPNGAVIAFGTAIGPRRPYAFAIRFNAAGQLDRGFGVRGRVGLGPSNSSTEVYDVAVQSDGSLVAIGSSGSERAPRWFVARYTPDGKPDRGFGRDGRATLDRVRVPPSVDPRKLNQGNRDGAITAGPDGTTVGVASLTGPDGGTVRSLAFRLGSSGKLDPGFGRRGFKLVQHLG